MKLRFLGWGAAVVGVVVVTWASGGTNVPQYDIPELLKSANPEIAEAEIALDGCQLTIRNEKQSADGLMTSVVMLDADLRMFDFNAMQIATRDDGRLSVRVKRAPATAELVEQASKVMALLPENLAPQLGTLTSAPRKGAPVAVQKVMTEALNGWSKPQLFEFLSQPDATLAVRLDGVRTKGDDETVARIRPHADAPEFHSFVKAVQRVDGPKTVSSALIFAGIDRNPDKLVSALVAIPNMLVLSATTQIGARALAQALADYKGTHCTGGLRAGG